MKKRFVTVILSVVLAVCLTFTGIIPSTMSDATETDTVGKIFCWQELAVSPQGAVDLAWDAVENAARYELYSFEEDGWEVCGSETATTKRICSLPDAATLFFRLQALDGENQILASSDVITVFTAPAAPTADAAMLAAGHCAVSWKAVDGADGYIVYADSDTRIADTQKTQISVPADKLTDAFVSVSSYRYIDGVFCESKKTKMPVVTDNDIKINLTIGLGETVSLAGYAVGNTAWRSADSQIADVENDCITAHKLGRTQILAETQAGNFVITVNVLAAPQTVKFSENELTLTVGEKRDSELLLGGAASFSVAYESTDASIVSVDKNGVLTANRAGEATVTATLFNGAAAEMTVTVQAERTIAFAKNKLTLGAGEKVSNPVLSDGKTVKNIRFSGAEDIVFADANGNITAFAAGQADLIAETADGAETVCSITVVSAPKRLTISEDELQLGVGAASTLTLRADSAVDLSRIRWESNDEAVATVEKGVVRATGIGTTVVSATLYNGVFAECVVTVLAAPEKLILNKNSHTLYEGEEHLLTVGTQADAWAGTLSFVSSDTSVLTVDKAGNVKALKAGKATVTVTAYNGVKAECVYTVLTNATAVTVKSSAMTFAVGMYSRMTATTDTGDGLEGAVWTVSDESIAVLNEKNHLIGKKAGKVTVTVTLANGVKGSCTVTVQAAPTSISLDKTTLSLDINARYRLKTAVNSGAYASAITFSSSDEAVARVEADGTVIAVAPGTATVTARTFNGKTASCAVTVKAQPTSISFASSSYSQQQGSWFYVTVYDQNKDKYDAATFTSSDTSVATVGADGLVHVLKMGTATITAKSTNGKTATCRINVSRMQVPLVSQLPDYPTGCEAASCAMLLRYYGYNFTTANMVSIIPRENIRYVNGYPVGPDINEKFVGDPRYTYTSENPGYGVFSPAVTKALQYAVDYVGGDETAVCITGCSYSELLGYLADGYPVIVWSTYNMNVPSTVNEWYIDRGNGKYEYFSYPRGTHVTVLCGYDGSRIYMMDPYDNACLSFSSSTFKARWDLLGNQGVILK